MYEVMRTQVRLPKHLADWLKQSAKQHHRSMNSELIAVLEQFKAKASEA